MSKGGEQLCVTCFEVERSARRAAGDTEQRVSRRVNGIYRVPIFDKSGKVAGHELRAGHVDVVRMARRGF